MTNRFSAYGRDRLTTTARGCVLLVLVLSCGIRSVQAAPEVDWQAESVLQQRHLVEIGGYLGMLFMSSRHALEAPGTTHQDFAPVSASFGGRVSYMRWAVFGVELEGGIAPTVTEDNDFALLYAVRAHAIGQYPVWRRLCLFALLGGGILGLASDGDVMGRNINGAFHWGGGLKYYLNDRLSMRTDFRHLISEGIGIQEANHFEFTFGAAWVLGWRQDRDGDGVEDKHDRCPQQAANTASGCPITDSDGDGIDDDEDMCPMRRATSPDGCPPREEDIDGDGLPDSRDKCPREQESFNDFEDEDGCPDEAPDPFKAFNEATQGPQATQGMVNFAVGKAVIARDSYPVLDAAAAVMRQYGELRLLIRGHTDSTGSRKRNIKLSLRRAEAVRNYFVRKKVARSRIAVEGVGPAEPIGDNKTKQGRALNRRIEFRLDVDPDYVAPPSKSNPPKGEPEGSDGSSGDGTAAQPSHPADQGDKR